MKKILSKKLYESNISKPEAKYPIDKCLDLVRFRWDLEKTHNINIEEIPVKGSKYDTESFTSWLGELVDPIFPKPSMADVSYEYNKKKFSAVGMGCKKYKYFESDSVYEMPKQHNSSNDEENHKKRIEDFKNNMAKMGKPVSDENLKHVNFGSKNKEWVNIVLDKAYELYPQHYKNGKLRIWIDKEYEGYDQGKHMYDYPMDKAYFMSELQHWIADTFETDPTEFFDWVLREQYIEGRWWMRTWSYEFKDINFRKEEAPENVKKINEILRHIYKTDSMDIYFDEYKKKDEEKIY